MKKIFLSLLTIAVIGFTEGAMAQCSIKDVFINIPALTPNNTPNPVQDGTGCKAYFDVTFKFNNNGGNKVVVIQAWKGDSQNRPVSDPAYNGDYPNYFQCVNGTSDEKKPPKLADLKRNGTGPLPFLNIGFNIEYFTDGDPATNPVLSVYSPDAANVSFTQTATSNPYIIENITAEDADGFRTITMKNLLVTVPNYICGNGVNFSVDVFSSQAASANWPIHCVICNQSFAFNYPLVNATIFCNNPSTNENSYRLQINNINTSQIVSATWKAYLDAAPFNDPENPTGPGAEDLLVHTQGVPQILQPGENIFFGPYQYTAGLTTAQKSMNLIVVVEPAGFATDVVTVAVNGCIITPVSFKSFTAARNRSNVGLKWETLTELNNAGFTVQRNIGGTWQDIAFVPSQAAGGNSDALLTYTLNDLNPTKGISQYRLRQVDLDGKFKLSEIRAVRGEGQLGKTIVYPNPSNTGNVTIVFEDANVKRDVSVIDVSGKIIKQWRNVSNNNLQLENLPSGVFSVRILALETGEQVVEKIIVNKR